MDTTLWYQRVIDQRTTLPAPPTTDDAYPDSYLESLSYALDSLVLPRELATQTGMAMERIMQRNLRRPPGSQTIIAIGAPYGAGKSTFALQWGYQRHLHLLGGHASQARPEWAPEPGVVADLTPVVYVTVPSGAGIKELNAQLLTFLGYPSEGITRATTTRLVSALQRHKVRLIILDDVHLIKRSEKASRQTLDYLKFLNTELGSLNGTLLLVGADLRESDITTDPQIQARLRTFYLDPFRIKDAASAKAWQRFLHGAEQVLLPVVPWIAPGTFSATHAKTIWDRTQGFPGDVTQLLADVILDVATHHLDEVTTDHLNAITLSDRAMQREADMTIGA